MPELWSETEDSLPSVAKQSCSAHLKLLHSSSAAGVVRQDQDEPGDVNLLLSPLTLAFAGGNTCRCCQSQRCYSQPRRRVSSVQHRHSTWRRRTLNLDIANWFWEEPWGTEAVGEGLGDRGNVLEKKKTREKLLAASLPTLLTVSSFQERSNLSFLQKCGYSVRLTSAHTHWRRLKNYSEVKLNFLSSLTGVILLR